jgi:hypothetical protein
MPIKTKIIDIKTKEEIFPEKVSIQELRKIWNDKERMYTDEELERIRNWLYSMAEVIVKVTARVKQNYKLIQTKNEHENTQSHSLRKSEHRRAS